MNKSIFCGGISLCLLAGLSATLPLDAVEDRTFPVRAAQANAFEGAISASVAQAQETLDDAVARYYAGLQGKARFFCTVRLADEQGQIEQVYVEVSKWASQISGRISNQVKRLHGFTKGQEVSFDQADVLDWTILHKDGREEGNFVGKFLRSLDKSQAVR